MKYIDPNGKDWVMRGIDGKAYFYYDKDVSSYKDIKNKYGDGKIAGHIVLIKEGQQLSVTGHDGNKRSYTFSNENKSFTDAGGEALGETDWLVGKNFAVIGTGDKNVDGSTLHNNIFGTSMTGPNNPQTNEDQEYTGYLPFLTNHENSSRSHDLRYNKGGATGVQGALTDVNVGIADIQLTVDNALNVFNPTIGGRERFQSAATATAFGVISTFKILTSPILGPYTRYTKENRKNGK